ncbi:MAG: threonine synthase [Clostridiales bacterium]|nr:threonine synthase [Clostridiales bacterium]
MEYVSTRNPSIRVRSSKAILDGQAEGGGLYVPADIDLIKTDYHDIIKGDFRSMAKAVWNIFFDDYGEEEIDRLVEASYRDKFSSPDITPLVKVSGKTGDAYVLELWHGPTSAFKDVALSALPNLMSAARGMNDFTDDIMILTATSGDTGSAAIQGFRDVPGTGIIVFYPHGGVSDTQRLQMVTPASYNVTACAIRGNFDDAQTGVKKLFREIPKPVKGVSLSSANSINIGRLVPQIVYYFSAYAQLIEKGVIKDGDKVDYVVPTGNFGDIMAGWYALKMGLPVGRLVCASNKNDVLTDFLWTGRYDRKRDFYKTTSPSMDILVSSNLERLLWYICGADHTLAYMKQLETTGEYQITDDELFEMQKVFTGVFSNDDEGAAAIRDVFESDKYLMDTHTSIAWACMEKYRSGDAPSGTVPFGSDAAATVVLSTASPYKFSAAVLEALGEELTGSDEGNMKKVREITGAEVPSGLAGIFSKPVIHKDVIEISDMKPYVIEKCTKQG